MRRSMRYTPGGSCGSHKPAAGRWDCVRRRRPCRRRASLRRRCLRQDGGVPPFRPTRAVYRYTFQNRCSENLELVLQNGLTTVFLNTKGKNDAEVEPELISFLRFVENSTAEEARQSADGRIQRMYGRINDLKNREDVEADYMKAEEYRRLMREEAREEGREEGRVETLI